MAIKSGEIIHVGNTVLVDRLQNVGPGTLNIPEETIYEVGNYDSVDIVRDIPDLTFTMESFDASAEVEAMLLHEDFANDAAGTGYALAESVPLDVLGQFKAGKKAASPYNVVGSAVIPFLALESASYRFGLRDNATQTFTLRGDSIYYAAASAYSVEAAGSAAAGQVVPFGNTAIPHTDPVEGQKYALNVSIVETGKRLVLGTDYTETATGVTITAAVPASETIRVVWQSASVAAYPQESHAVASATRPAAIRGRDIEVRVGGNAVGDRWSSIQSVNVDYRVTLDRDEEFYNPRVVAQDYDVPAVSGTINIKPRDFAELMTRLRKISGVAGPNSVGATVTVPLSLDIILHSPANGDVLKTLYVEDARFQIPAYSARVQQKQTLDLAFTSQKGKLVAYKGARS